MNIVVVVGRGIVFAVVGGGGGGGGSCHCGHGHGCCVVGGWWWLQLQLLVDWIGLWVTRSDQLLIWVYCWLAILP